MSTLPPHLEALEHDLVRAATRRVRTLRRRRRMLQLTVAGATALGLTAGALAASGVDLGQWLSGSDQPGQARFVVDASRTYGGPRPGVIGCQAAAGEVRCRPGPAAAGSRAYRRAMLVERPPSVARADIERAIVDARARGVDPPLVDRIERELSLVPPEFFVNLQVLRSLGFFATGLSGTGGTALAPPPGLPFVLVCDEQERAWLSCEDLRGARMVPVGAPVYVQQRASDWVPAPPADAEGDQADVGALIEEIWGRPLEPTEVQLLLDLSTPVSTGSGDSETEPVEEVATVPYGG